jgi:hypothetical protein
VLQPGIEPRFLVRPACSLFNDHKDKGGDDDDDNYNTGNNNNNNNNVKR